jgi:hypothetical protein
MEPELEEVLAQLGILSIFMEEEEEEINPGWEDVPGGNWEEPEDETCEHGLSAWLCEGPNHHPEGM